MSDPQTKGAFPIEKPPVTPEERLNHAKHVLDSVQLPKPLPPNFDPLQASPEDLESYGLPPRPVNAPDNEAKWEKLMAEMKKAKLVIPEFEIVQHDNIPLKVNADGDGKERNWTGTNWAGAVIPNSKFSWIQANWEIPNPVPGKGNSKAWYSSAWIGIDGWTSPDVLQGGTGHDVYLVDGNVSRDFYAWYEWYPAYPIRVKNFTLSAGNRVTCNVWPSNDTTGNFYIYNWDNNQYVSVKFRAPVGTRLRGDSAEWVVEDPWDRLPEANFKVIEFDNCWAIRNGAWVNLSSAETVVSTCADGTFCTATIETDTTLVVTYH